MTFISAMPEIPTVDVLAALIVFRGFYLLLPFALAIVVVLGFELGQWRLRRQNRHQDLSGTVLLGAGDNPTAHGLEVCLQVPLRCSNLHRQAPAILAPAAAVSPCMRLNRL